MNPTLPYGEHTFTEEQAESEFKSSHTQRDFDEACPHADECGGGLEYWESSVAGVPDYAWCPDCGYTRAYRPDQ